MCRTVSLQEILGVPDFHKSLRMIPRRLVSPWKQRVPPLPGCFEHSCWCAWSGPDPTKSLRTIWTQPPWCCGRPESVRRQNQDECETSVSWRAPGKTLATTTPSRWNTGVCEQLVSLVLITKTVTTEERVHTILCVYWGEMPAVVSPELWW